MNHPARIGAASTFGRWVGRPLAFCTLPVMVLTLEGALRGGDILPYLTVGFPVAFFLAAAWTAFRMRSVPAELVVEGSFADLRTVLDVVTGRSSHPNLPVLDLRRSAGNFEVAMGEAVYVFSDRDWPEAEKLVESLAIARGSYAEEWHAAPGEGVRG